MGVLEKGGKKTQQWFPFIKDFELKEGEWSPHQEKLPDEAFSSRRCVLNAYADLMVKLFDEHFPGNKFIADVGSGTGFPYAVLPGRIRKNVILTDWNPKYVGELRKRFPDADVRKANAYSLPFLPHILDGVVGCGSYDTMQDIEKAVKSMATSLKKCGTFMHILDTNPDPAAVREWMKKDGKSFPKVLLGKPCTGVTEIGEDTTYFDSEETLQRYDKARADDLRRFGSEMRYGEESAKILRTRGKHADFRGEFKRIIRRLLEENGFTIVRDGRASGEWEGKREKRHHIQDSSAWDLPEIPEHNWLKSFEGVKYVRGFAEPFGYLKGKPTPETIKEKVEVDVVVARKE